MITHSDGSGTILPNVFDSFQQSWANLFPGTHSLDPCIQNSSTLLWRDVVSRPTSTPEEVWDYDPVATYASQMVCSLEGIVVEAKDVCSI